MTNRPPSHKPAGQSRKPYDKEYNRRRLSDSRSWVEHQRRSARYQRLRKSHLQREPLCRECLAEGRTTAAREVHHIQGAHARPDLFFSDDNLMSLCVKHHRRIEAELRAR